MNPEELSGEELSLAKRFTLLVRAYLRALKKGSPTARLVTLIRKALINAARDAALKAWRFVARSLLSRNRARVSKKVAARIEAQAELTIDGLHRRAAEPDFPSRITPYAQLVSGGTIRAAAADAAREAAITCGATHKTWRRARPVREPRSHSILEGRTLPINVPFNVNGTQAFGPHDSALPLREVIGCTHYLDFRK